MRWGRGTKATGRGASAVSTTRSWLRGSDPPQPPPSLSSSAPSPAAAHVLPHLTASGAGVRTKEGPREPKASAALGEGPYSTHSRGLATEPCLPLQ